MPTEIRNPGRPLTRADIEAVERRLNVNFPSQYVSFLLAHNGGRPKPDVYRSIEPNDDGAVHYFFSVDGDSYYKNLVQQVEDFWSDEEHSRRDLMPIARAPSEGDLVCLGVGAVRHGEVFFWSDENLARSRQGWRLADDLDSFLATFHPFDPREAFK